MAESNHSIDVQKILVSTDFSPAADRALLYALKIALEAEAELLVLHVLEGPPALAWDRLPEGFLLEREKSHEEIRKRLEAMIAEYLHAGLVASLPVVRPLVVDGDPAAEIVMTAFDCRVDLIVTATQGEREGAGATVGSTAGKVIRYASCPVLVVRESKDELNLPPIHSSDEGQRWRERASVLMGHGGEPRSR